jgi:hypothetical protein
VARGLLGVQLAISDAHPGLKAALATVLGTPWQRYTVHFFRDLRGHARKDQHDALGAVIRQIFTASTGEEARSRLGDAVAQPEPRLQIAALLEACRGRRARLLDAGGPRAGSDEVAALPGQPVGLPVALPNNVARDPRRSARSTVRVACTTAEASPSG